MVAAESYNSATDKNFIPQLSKFKSVNADWILVTGAGPAAGLILKQKAEIGYTANVFGSTTFPIAGISTLVQIGGPAAVDGTYIATVPFSVWDTFPPEDTRTKPSLSSARHLRPSTITIQNRLNGGLRRTTTSACCSPKASSAPVQMSRAQRSRPRLKAFRAIKGVLGVSFNFSPERHSGGSGVVVGQIKDGKVVLVK